MTERSADFGTDGGSQSLSDPPQQGLCSRGRAMLLLVVQPEVACVACYPCRASAPVPPGCEVLMLMVQPEVAEQVRQAQHRRTVRLHAAGTPQSEGPQQLRHVVHISTDMRKVWIGDAEGDRTQGGLHPMDFAKVAQTPRVLSPCQMLYAWPCLVRIALPICELFRKMSQRLVGQEAP